MYSIEYGIREWDFCNLQPVISKLLNEAYIPHTEF